MEDPWSGDISELEGVWDNVFKRTEGDIDVSEQPENDHTRLRADNQYVGFDDNVGQTWIYPSNLPCRSYQLSMAQAALYRNTLVVLPTGLGKTFIAAVVMYNIYRWYPKGKVLFMAPTRPLVAQQIGACQHIMPFPSADTVDITGKVRREKRMEYWRTKRVFFATPQVVQADMSPQSELDEPFPFKDIKLIVVDEAHKAKGRYAYTEVAQMLLRNNRHFRVLALSATPGRTMEDVAEVVRNLFISHLEVRWDNSIDVTTYIHKRSMKTVVVPLGEKIKHIREELVKIIDPYLRQLIDAGVLSGSHQHITRNFLIFEQKRFRERSLHERHPEQAAVNSHFSICISLFHSLELLERHGLRVFINNFEDDNEGRQKFVITMNPALRDLVNRIRDELGPNPFDISAHNMTNGRLPEIPADLDFGHPKFQRARECLLEHFEKNPESRAIVFCEYRESVMLMFRLLLQHVPLLKPRCFVGQGGTTGSLRALSQKQQIQIMADFRTGKSNILIATSIGEEGIDVGEVDLIVCFDISSSNPTRFIQRIGRTGRQRMGYVVILVTEGKEQQILKEVLANKDQINKKILNSSIVKTAFYKESPRLVPTEYNPKCVQTFVKPTEQVEQSEKAVNKRKEKKTSSKNAISKPKAIINTQDLRKFFKKPVDEDVDAEELEIFELPSNSRTAVTQRTSESCMDKVKSLFKDLNMNPLSNSNTQLLETQNTTTTTTSEKPQSSISIPRLSVKEIKRLNRLLKSSNDLVPLSQRKANLLEKLRSNNFSHAGKMHLLKHRVVDIRQFFEKMEILQALDADNDMSIEEREVRETCQEILALFKDREALERFLEDAEYDSQIQDRNVNNELDEFTMSSGNFNLALNKIFTGLDQQGFSWDSFDYRQEEVQKTNGYKEFIAKCNAISGEEKSYGMLNSVVFDGKPCDTTSQFDEITIMDSKYCSQWNEVIGESPSSKPTVDITTQCDEVSYRSPSVCSSKSSIYHGDSFVKKNMSNQSTPLSGPLVKAFEKQIDKPLDTTSQLDETSIMDPKYCSQWNEVINEATSSKPTQCDEVSYRSPSVCSSKSSIQQGETFVKKKMHYQSTPLSGPLVKAFERQKDKQMARKSLEGSLGNKSFNNDSMTIEIDSDDNDLLSCVLVDDKSPAKLVSKACDKKSCSYNSVVSTAKLQPKDEVRQKMASPKSIEMSFMLRQQSTPVPNKLSSVKKSAIIDDSLHHALEVNLDDFAEPFPEELDFLTQKPDSFSGSSSKENSRPNASKVSTQHSPQTSHTSNLFQLLESKPTNSVMTPKLTYKIYKRSNDTTPPKQHNSPKFVSTSTILDSPKTRLNTSLAIKNHETSPSIMCSFIKGLQRMESVRKFSKNPTNSITQDNDSPILPKQNKDANLKRKIIDSETESEVTPPTVYNRNNSDSDFEEIAGTQRPKRRCLIQRREKRLRRARLCPFFDQEAEKSNGSGHTTEEDDGENTENTLANFVCDSVIVDDNDCSKSEDDDRPTGTQMQAVYLQSVKSPYQRRGGFKIPERREFPIHENIYSQEAPIEQTQYDDSFVVGDEGDATIQKTLCPLERAEEILKQRRRQAKRRRFAEVGVVNPVRKRIRKCYQLQDDSDTSDGVV